MPSLPFIASFKDSFMRIEVEREAEPENTKKLWHQFNSFLYAYKILVIILNIKAKYVVCCDHVIGPLLNIGRRTSELP